MNGCFYAKNKQRLQLAFEILKKLFGYIFKYKLHLFIFPILKTETFLLHIPIIS